MKQSRKSKRAIFFAYTGTIYDPQSDQKAHLESAREIVRHFKLDVTPQSLLERFSERADRYLAQRDADEFLAGDDMLRAVLPHFGTILQVPKTREHFLFVKEVTRKMHCVHGALMPGAEEALSGIRERGFHVGLISHVDGDLLGSLLDSLGIRDYFDSVTTAEEAQVCRPDPRIFELAVGKAEITTKQAYFVSDDPHRDIPTARKLGFATIYLRAAPDAGKDCPEADFEIGALTDLLPILDREAARK
ncbi:MAG: HAD-IA family hydrolase [Candidatus Wallbacteria bacterium]|nr:HAD-IA family hydrolase [Candidatus Wallbacteria bacterium]MBI4866304.1 HAD-IA family hydrolase [Candidatus Wallbacteria bacterium]